MSTEPDMGLIFLLLTQCKIGRHEQTDTKATEQIGELTLTLLWEGLLKNTLVKTAERSTEVFEVRETQLLVPWFWDRQTILGLWSWRGRWRRLGGLLEAQGLGRRLWVATHLQVREKRSKKRQADKWENQRRYWFQKNTIKPEKGLLIHFTETNKARMLAEWGSHHRAKANPGSPFTIICNITP